MVISAPSVHGLLYFAIAVFLHYEIEHFEFEFKEHFLFFGYELCIGVFQIYG